MSQKSVIVVTSVPSAMAFNIESTELDVKLFSSLKIACKYYEWQYNTLARKGDTFRHKAHLIQRKNINRNIDDVW